MQSIQPIAYCRNRNFIDGDVTYLSPYISRGVISTKQVFDFLKAQNFDLKQIEKFVQELAWRDYWQQIWKTKSDAINQDFKQEQANVEHRQIPSAVLKVSTSIQAIDGAIEALYATGYMHNHVRMYVAAIACNLGHAHWHQPAQWMYYHLIDGDWASNALSWQWVAGSNSKKKYFANQANINKYCHTNQTQTFLDVEYDAFPNMQTPEVLLAHKALHLQTNLESIPQTELTLDKNKAIAVYNYYNLDPLWMKAKDLNRVLLLEPSKFEQYPISERCMSFALDLAKNINDIQIYVGEFETLATQTVNDIHFKEHPLNKNYKGIKHERDWMFAVEGYYPSFFAFWKRCKKEIKYG